MTPSYCEAENIHGMTPYCMTAKYIQPAIKRSTGVAPEMHLMGMYFTFTFAKQANKLEPTLTLNLRGDVKNRGASGPKKGHVNVSDNKTLQKEKNYQTF